MGKIPATCKKLQDQSKALLDQIQEIQSDPGYIQGSDGPKPGKPDPTALVEVKALRAKINSLALAFNQCLVNNVKDLPIRIKASSIVCVEEQEGGVLQDDEPYLLVVSIDLTAGILPTLEVFLYGPFEDVNTGESRNAGGTPFWAANGTAQSIENPNDVIFLVAFMENDDGTPSFARTLLKTALTASMAATPGATRAALITVLRNDMADALSFPGFPDSDDRIGPIQELRLTPLDLVRPIVGPHVLRLTFEGSGAKYVANFTLTEG